MFRSYCGPTDLGKQMLILTKHLIFDFTVSSLPKRCQNLDCFWSVFVLKNAFNIARYQLAVLKQ